MTSKWENNWRKIGYYASLVLIGGVMLALVACSKKPTEQPLEAIQPPTISVIETIVTQIFPSETPTLIPSPFPSETPSPTPELENLVVNPSFELGSEGWDMRYGAGPDGGYLGQIVEDPEFCHSGSRCLYIPPSVNATNTGECDRTVWQAQRIPVSEYRGKTIKLSAWLKHGGCDSSTDNCWVNPKYAGNMEVTNWDACPDDDPWCENREHFQGPWGDESDSGGARLGGDFRQSEEMFREHLVTLDWTTPANTWFYLELETVVPEKYSPTGHTHIYDADTFIVWYQAFKCLTNTDIWLDDVSVAILD